MITNAVLLPAGACVTPEEILIESDSFVDAVQEIVGGVYDAVRYEDDDMGFVGYVNDNFISEGLEYNYLATALFGQPLSGNVVVFWTLDENNEYTGEDYDVPEKFVQFINGEFLERVADCYNISVHMAIFFEMAVEQNVITLDDGEFVGRALASNADGTITDDDASRLNDILDTVNTWGQSLDELALMRYIVEKSDAQNN